MVCFRSSIGNMVLYFQNNDSELGIFFPMFSTRETFLYNDGYMYLFLNLSVFRCNQRSSKKTFIRLPVCDTFFTMFHSWYHHNISRSDYRWQKWCSYKKAKTRDQRPRSQRWKQILLQFGHFRAVTRVWIHWWLWNDAQSLKSHRRGALLLFKVIHQISRTHATTDRRFSPELSSSLNSQMAMKWCTNLEVP